MNETKLAGKLELAANLNNTSDPEKAAAILAQAIAALEPLTDWTPEAIDEKLEAVIGASGMKMGTFMWPVRIALSGQKVTPGGVTELLYILGQKNSLKRLEKGLAKIHSIV